MTQMTRTAQKNEQDQPSTNEDAAVLDISTLIDPSRPSLTLFSTRVSEVPEQLRLLIFKDLDEAIASGSVRVIPATSDTLTMKVLDERGSLVDWKFDDLWIRLNADFENWIETKTDQCLYHMIESTGKIKVSSEPVSAADFDVKKAELAYQNFALAQLSSGADRKAIAAKRSVQKSKKSAAQVSGTAAKSNQKKTDVGAAEPSDTTEQ